LGALIIGSLKKPKEVRSSVRRTINSGKAITVSLSALIYLLTVGNPLELRQLPKEV
jgi:hypothetical protein